MKRLSLLLLLGLLPVVVLIADPVDKDAARLKAEAFFMKKNPSSARRAQVRQDIRLALTNESFHVFNLGEDGGFVMIAGDDCYQPILRAYFRSKTPQSVSAASEGLAEVKMVGTFTPVSFEEDYSGTFFIDGSNDLYAATEWSYLNSFRAYFDVPSLHSGTATVKQIVVDFADAPDGIERISEFSEFSEHSEFSEKAPAFFDLSGRKMVNGQWSNGKLKKGIYITGGKKVVIK
jgi:hypothetical protein